TAIRLYATVSSRQRLSLGDKAPLSEYPSKEISQAFSSNSLKKLIFAG
ncbi:hypothetical protein HMPREF1869_00920, partial [Bacteroidales bacterium KA00251]